jgi:hydrogenase-4 component F
VSGALFLAGFFAITGSPPFAPFVSELTILRSAFADGRTAIAIAFLVLLFIVFVAMGGTVLAIVQGSPRADVPRNDFRDTLGTTAPACLLLAAVLVLGVWLPPGVERALADAAALVEGTRR